MHCAFDHEPVGTGSGVAHWLDYTKSVLLLNFAGSALDAGRCAGRCIPVGGRLLQVCREQPPSPGALFLLKYFPDLDGTEVTLKQWLN